MSEFRQRKARARVQEARAALAREDYASAASAFAAGVRLDPGDAEAWLEWAECLERRGKLLESAEILREALGHHDGDPQLELGLAHALIETGQFAAAHATILGLHARWPEQRPPLAYVARILRDIRAYGALRELLDEALAGPLAGDRELVGLRDACLGWQGVHREAPPVLASMRELVLTLYGAVLLGTGHDDGVTVPWYSTYLCSNYDVVATSARLLGFCRAFDWRWSTIAAIDPAAMPLALLLADALGARAVELPAPDSPIEDYPDPDDSLAVASFVAPGWSGGPHGEWAQRCADAGGMFAFGALDYANHREGLPPILGLAAGERVCLPWWRLGEARIGFARFGLIDDLPPEIDQRSPAQIADDYAAPLAEFETGPNFVIQLRHVLDHRHELQPGLRERSDFARILPHAEARIGPKRSVDEAMHRGDTAEFLRALSALERDLMAIDEATLAALEARFVSTPEIRSRLSDLLYRVAPDRLAALVHELVARPEDAVPMRERDSLLHLYGCNPWTGAGRDPSRATAELERWIELGVMTNRSEIVQSKYGLHHLAESPRFAATLAALLADEPPIVLGTIRWLHDNPQLHGHVIELLALLDHDHADVVFEVLQCTREAQLALTPAQLEPLLAGQRHAHPRMLSAAVEHLELWPIAQAHPRLRAYLDADEPTVAWAAARSLLRGGADLDERVAGASVLADGLLARFARFEAREAETGSADELDLRPLLRALSTASAFELVEPLLARIDTLSRMKIVAAALAPTLLAFDDPRLVPYLRRWAPAFALDPPVGYASFLRRHGDPAADRDAVFGAQGATEPRAGYEAKAVLAAWGDGDARAELRAAARYASPAREAAFEAAFRVVHSDDYARLDAAREDPDADYVARLWTVLCATIAGPHPAPLAWREGLAAFVDEDAAREQGWAAFIEAQLRAQIPSKFVVGAQSASFAVLAELLPARFDDLVARSLAGVPDRVSVDLLEWLALHDRPRAREWAARAVDSPHWGVRQAARRILDA